MLENKEAAFEVGKVVAFRIVSGEELVGKVTSFDSHSVSLKKPCTLTFDPNQGGVGLMPASLMADPEKDVVYQRTAIIAMMTPRADAVGAYESYATSLVLPQKEGIVTAADSAK